MGWYWDPSIYVEKRENVSKGWQRSKGDFRLSDTQVLQQLEDKVEMFFTLPWRDWMWLLQLGDAWEDMIWLMPMYVESWLSRDDIRVLLGNPDHSLLFDIVGRPTHATWITTYKTRHTGLRTIVPNFWASSPVKNGANAPPLEPSPEINPSEVICRSLGRSFANTPAAQG